MSREDLFVIATIHDTNSAVEGYWWWLLTYIVKGKEAVA